MDKKYKYRNGEPARILCLDYNAKTYPVISLNEKRNIQTHTKDGIYNLNEQKNDYDLIEVKEKKKIELWVNVYPNGGSCIFRSKKDADYDAINWNRTACLHIVQEYEDGV